MTMRIIERFEGGIRIEAGFADLPDDAPRPEAPTSSPEAPEEATLTATDHALAIAVLTGKITVVIVATWLLLGAAVAILWTAGRTTLSDPCFTDTMRLARCSALAQ
jgi:hypothetical protein